MSAPGSNLRVFASIGVILLLSLGAQLQRFVQSYNDELRAASQTASGDKPNSMPRKEFVGDFQVYYTSSVVLRHSADHQLYYPEPGGQILMDNVPEDTTWGRAAKDAGFKSTMRFIYPPFAAVLLEPLSLLSWPKALLLWRVFLLTFVLLSIYLCVSLTGTEYFWLKFGLATVAALSFFPLIEAFAEGQIDPLILLFWVAGIYLFEKGHSTCSAFMFALGTVVKVSPVLVVALFILRRQWKWLASYILSVAGLTGISIWRLGWNNHVQFMREVLPKLSCGMALLANRSLPGLIYDIYLRRVPIEMGPAVPAWLCTAVKTLGIVLLAEVLYLVWRRHKGISRPLDEFMIFALLTLLISPVSWRHHYLLALFPLICLWAGRASRGFAIAVLAVVTLSIGSVLPDYAIAAIRNPALDLLLVSVTPISTLLLLWTLCAGYWDAEAEIAGAAGASSSSRSF